MKNEVVPILSLFSGVGGMDCGFRKAGLRPMLAFDKDSAAVRSYNFNAKRKIATSLDLVRLSDQQLSIALADGPLPKGVIGGPPCQGFSVGNASSDPNDPRNLLPYQYARILESLNRRNRVDFFAFENVPGLKSPRHLPRYRRIIRRFEKAGFVVHENEIDAYNFSVAQRRRRLFLVGLNAGIDGATNFSFPSATGECLTVRDAIAHLPEPAFRTGNMTRNDIPYHPNHWTMEPRSKRFKEQSFNKGRSFRKLTWDEPSWTVAYGNREIHIHPEGHRRLSILEALLLQGFPESFVLCGNFSQQVDQVSNAVPPPVAFAIARAIRAKLYSNGRKP